mmetsp:Transcript_22698/g.53610  ORF Transcript_22698/g.53610 Transcript_22698/m.53610 type:complete len:102 (+) Transcript_22698:191-496(+)
MWLYGIDCKHKQVSNRLRRVCTKERGWVTHSLEGGYVEDSVWRRETRHKTLKAWSNRHCSICVNEGKRSAIPTFVKDGKRSELVTIHFSDKVLLPWPAVLA